jgi:hypothetical protein
MMRSGAAQMQVFTIFHAFAARKIGPGVLRIILTAITTIFRAKDDSFLGDSVNNLSVHRPPAERTTDYLIKKGFP